MPDSSDSAKPDQGLAKVIEFFLKINFELVKGNKLDFRVEDTEVDI